MIRPINHASLMVCAWLAVAVISPDAAGAKSSGAASSAPTEVQIGLCGRPEQIQRALKLHPHGAAPDEWLFDDAALTLSSAGCGFDCASRQIPQVSL